MTVEVRPSPHVDLEGLGLDAGGHLLLKRAVAAVPPGTLVRITGRGDALRAHLGAWCRAEGHDLERLASTDGGVIEAHVRRGHTDRWHGAARAGAADPGREGAVVESPPARWGFAARGARVEVGSPDVAFRLDRKSAVWADEAARLYAQATAAQWDPASAIPWSDRVDLPDEVEDAVVQVMTYLVENETAALVVPARFLAEVHPHFREVMQLLAIQVADEARHVEVFTRRALLRRTEPALSAAGGQRSLATLRDEPDFALASFLLSVLGEGTFLSLLWFLRDHAPDPVTREVVTLAAQDEARHVAFAMAHLGRHAAEDPTLRPRLARAVERRHDALREAAGLNAEVFDALLILAAGSFRPADVARGHGAVLGLVKEMDEGRRQRLRRLGFSDGEAEAVSALHTKNFM